MKEEMYYYWLHNVPGIGNGTIKKLLETATPRQIYGNGIKEVQHLLKPSQQKNLEQHRKNWDLEEEWKKLEEKHIEMFYLGGEGYPKKLENIPDAPIIIYKKGKGECFHKPAVAVIGARACSAYGSLAAKELGRALAEMGIVVVSGMARGIDGISQWYALEHGGASIGVLGSGVEICYPKENLQLYDKLIGQGCVLSENLPYTEPKPGLFPLRNRIISGLADVLVVVEAREKSGTLITVDMALEQGKEVYAMPGRITEPLSRGCNHLIKQGAGMMLSPREFVEEICPLLQLKYQESHNALPEICLSAREKEIYGLLDVLPKSMEEIWGLGKQKNPALALPQVMEILLELCMKGMVTAQGQYYYKTLPLRPQ